MAELQKNIDFQHAVVYNKIKNVPQKRIIKNETSKKQDIAIYFAVFVSIIFSVGLFMLLPNLLATVVAVFIKNRIVLNFAEGLIRMAIFLTYLF